EKLAVLAPNTTLALGAGLHPDAFAVARAAAAAQRARVVRVAPTDLGRAPFAPAEFAPAESAPAARSSAAVAVGWSRSSAPAPTFQWRNFALARVAAEAYLAHAGIAPREESVREALVACDVPGRLQLVGEHPLTVLDGAHNPDAACALVESLPSMLQGRPLALVMGVLEDKDAASMLMALLALCERAWFTAPPSPRALSPAALQSLARQQGFERAVSEPDPRRALALAQEWALTQAPPAAVLATGSIYLVGGLLRHLGEHERVPRGAAAAGEQAGPDRASGT
ncbi:MAG TPA: cyanophycin synthetase, partial [Solirubrobacteraceae bacterium]|nr:cyanophycin synthetase [Solirubrobacteraceae bacterium]